MLLLSLLLAASSAWRARCFLLWRESGAEAAGEEGRGAEMRGTASGEDDSSGAVRSMDDSEAVAAVAAEAAAAVAPAAAALRFLDAAFN